MAAETAESINAFADLQQFLNNNLDTPGSRVCNRKQNRTDRPTRRKRGENASGKSNQPDQKNRPRPEA